jgi:lantibiotic modifying enzyme
MTIRRDEEFLDVAALIGRRLCRDALWASERCNWLGDSREFIDGIWTVGHRSLGPDLYQGTSGIALFLAALYRLSPEPVLRATTLGALAHAHAQARKMPAAQRIGLYTGWTGIAYATASAGEVFGDQALIDKACDMLLEATTGEDEVLLDVLVGAAGAIVALIDMQRLAGRDLMTIACRLGERLLARAKRRESDWSWGSHAGATDRDLTGFSHGAGGIAWALLELSTATGETRFRDAAERGFAYERRHFSKTHENWPDLRADDPSSAGPPGYMVAWCHGASGIGLSRLRAYELTGDPVARGEAEAAMRTTMRTLTDPNLGPQSDFTLCHGRAGNAELFLAAADVSGDQTARAVAEGVGRYGIEVYRRKDLPWPCGVYEGGETPNLMLGLAGIGHFYLRLYDRENVPSVLLLRPRRNLAL